METTTRQNDILSIVNCWHSMLPVIGICIIFSIFWIRALEPEAVPVDYSSSATRQAEKVIYPYSEMIRGIIGDDGKVYNIRPPIAGEPC